VAEVALLARLALAGVLVLSGVAKLLDPAGSRDALRGFGVPARATAVGLLLPPLELALAVMLLVPATARWGAFGAVALLAVFTGAIALSLALGRRPNCHCFGSLSSDRIGTRTLVRNGALLLLAAVATYEGAAPGAILSTVSAPLPWLAIPLLLLGAALLGLGWLVLALWRQQARLLTRLDALEAGGTVIPVPPPAPARAAHAAMTGNGLAVGTSAPDIHGVDAEGVRVSLSRFWSQGKPALLVFGDPACDACKALYPEVAGWRTEHGASLETVLVSRGVGEDGPPPGLPLLIDSGDEARREYRVVGTPSAVVVSPSGEIASPLAPGAAAIRELVAATLGRPTAAPAPVRARRSTRHGASAFAPSGLPMKAGALLPEVSLEGAGGEPASPKPADADLLLLFWNERCQHCGAMAADLASWGARRNGNAPDVAFVVPLAGQAPAATDRLPGSTVFVDRTQSLSRALGVPGTPSAALVGRDGRLVSDVALGGDAVLRLLEGAVGANA
jgi:uncharacterized membrane protein YphA (DoxX/SURF4 family)